MAVMEVALFPKELWSALQAMLGPSSVESFLKSGSFVDLGSGEGELVLTALSLFPDLTKGVGVELSHERQKEAVRKAQESSPQVGSRAEFLQGDICDESNQKIVEAIATARLLFVTCFWLCVSVNSYSYGPTNNSIYIYLHEWN